MNTETRLAGDAGTAPHSESDTTSRGSRREDTAMRLDGLIDRGVDELDSAIERFRMLDSLALALIALVENIRPNESIQLLQFRFARFASTLQYLTLDSENATDTARSMWQESVEAVRRERARLGDAR